MPSMRPPGSTDKASGGDPMAAVNAVVDQVLAPEFAAGPVAIKVRHDEGKH
jgi:hypothetical protein